MLNRSALKVLIDTLIADNTTGAISEQDMRDVLKAIIDGSYNNVDDAATAMHYMANWDASGNAFPVTGGSGDSGDIARGDIFDISVAGNLAGIPVDVGATIWAREANPGQDLTKWKIIL